MVSPYSIAAAGMYVIGRAAETALPCQPMRWFLLVAAAAAALFAGSDVPYQPAAQRWLIDPEAAVARHDVVYAKPSNEPWEAMPVGGGDLSAMVRWDGALRLHLSKSDAWGFQAPPGAPAGTRFFNNVSPGHVRLVFGSKAAAAAARHFRQRLDLYGGRVVFEIGEHARILVWGHPVRRVLVVEVSDPGAVLDPRAVELIEWRPDMKVSAATAALVAREVHGRTARPHLANTGMEDWPDDPLLGRGLAVAVAAPGLGGSPRVENDRTVRLDLPASLSRTHRLLIAAAVTASGDPVEAAGRELEAASAAPLEEFRAEHQAWWRDYWSRSFLKIESPDPGVRRALAAYHVHLYTLACVNRGAVPAKWDGGPGLLDGDRRHWGLAEWIQEIRFTYWPLYAANRLDQASGLFAHYSRMRPYLERQTRSLWGLPGVWIPETALPWGHAEDYSLRPDAPVLPNFHRWEPRGQRYGRFSFYNPYVGFLFTAGLELAHHYLTYQRYTGDDAFLHEQVYPLLRGVSEFVIALFRPDASGRAVLEPANALETWWMVRNPADTIAGVAAVLPEFVRLSRAYGLDAELRERAERLLAALPDPPRGLWLEDGTHESDEGVWAPAGDGPPQRARNRENPALYRVAPFGLSGLDTPDVEIARRTFRQRIRPLSDGWSMDAIWAARLGLREEAASLLARHAERFNRFPYGGWTSNDSRYWPGGLSVTPFLDAGGVSATALQEMLLQSHGGILRLIPAVPDDWSGVFQLRAEGGFLVAADFAGGAVRFAEIRSLRGGPCRLANPWPDTAVIRRGGRVIHRGAGRRLTFPTAAGDVYGVERAAAPAPFAR